MDKMQNNGKNSNKIKNIISVIDPGTPISILKDLTIQNSNFISHHKFAWGSSLLFQSELEEKIRFLKSHNIKPYCGGTLFEIAHQRGEIAAFRTFLLRNGFDALEISTGSTSIDKSTIRSYIEKFSQEFEVIVEVGKKDQEESEAMYPEVWVDEITTALSSGATNIILEGRESGTSGIFRPNGDLRKGLLLEIIRHCPLNKLIFECSRKQDQLEVIKLFGNDIGFGNISMLEVASLAALLIGLRGDTINKLTTIDWQNT